MKRLPFLCLFFVSNFLWLSLIAGQCFADEPAMEETVVVAAFPGDRKLLPADRLPFTVYRSNTSEITEAISLDTTDFLSTRFPGVNINSAQNNPLQPDLQFRGYAASPLLGLSQGLAVYQNGVRINEALGDSVNWDLIPLTALESIQLSAGSNPIYGLNALGGGLSLQFKNGFTFTGAEFEVSGGTWERFTSSVQYGYNNGSWGIYFNINYFDEEGWRDLSESDALNFVSVGSYRGERLEVDFNIQYADTYLTGNGVSPAGLLRRDRDAIFTAPDLTENKMGMATINANWTFGDNFSAGLDTFIRKNRTNSFNGDASEFMVCELAGGDFLLEEINEETLETVGLDEDSICEDNVLGAVNPDGLEQLLNLTAGSDIFDLDSFSASELNGSGLLVDSAINNISVRKQKSFGGNFHAEASWSSLGLQHNSFFGVGYYKGLARFDAKVELSNIDPVSRSTAGLGVGTYVNEESTNIKADKQNASIYIADIVQLNERWSATFSARFNHTKVNLTDRTGLRSELNGSHTFNRLNPAGGLVVKILPWAELYLNASESSRTPTPIELACNEGVFEIARESARVRGGDPDDIDFECRLPNAFIADPPLEQVIARNVEFGIRGSVSGFQHKVSYFRTRNKNDIIFQTTGRSTGLFDNVDKTVREGVETSVVGELSKLKVSMNYTWLKATFEDEFNVLSPNHPNSSEDGSVLVRVGDQMPGIPENQFRASAEYQLSSSISVGLDFLLNSGQFLRGDEANLLSKTPGYGLVNLRGRYKYNGRFEVYFKTTNLFDKDYVNFGMLGEDPTEVLGSSASSSQIYYAPGSPIGFWVGARLNLW